MQCFKDVTLGMYVCKYLFSIFDCIFVSVEEKEIYQTNHVPAKAGETHKKSHKYNSKSEVLSAMKVVEITLDLEVEEVTSCWEMAKKMTFALKIEMI